MLQKKIQKNILYHLSNKNNFYLNVKKWKHISGGLKVVVVKLEWMENEYNLP